jgi:hypothetical protein
MRGLDRAPHPRGNHSQGGRSSLASTMNGRRTGMLSNTHAGQGSMRCAGPASKSKSAVSPWQMPHTAGASCCIDVARCRYACRASAAGAADVAELADACGRALLSGRRRGSAGRQPLHATRRDEGGNLLLIASLVVFTTRRENESLTDPTNAKDSFWGGCGKRGKYLYSAQDVEITLHNSASEAGSGCTLAGFAVSRDGVFDSGIKNKKCSAWSFSPGDSHIAAIVRGRSTNSASHTL